MITVLVAGGPSYSEAQAALVNSAHAAGKCHLLVVNRAWERHPQADVLYAADARWWRRYWPEVDRGFSGECWTCDAEIARAFGLCHVKLHSRARGLVLEDGIASGSNGGYQLIGLAYKFLREHGEAGPIVLVGYDMQHTGGRAHWHKDYSGDIDGKTTHWSNASGVKQWLPHFDQLAADLKRERIQVWNATAETALTCFERASLDDVLRGHA